ncbi:MAG: cytochrome c oxidase subunit II [Chloroflexi bacterium]|nr:MAG: cytochrome c oxidase subunit II [Chloroflexota bacterium]
MHLARSRFRRVHLHVLDQHPADHADEEDEPADDGEPDADRGRERDRRNAQEKRPGADDERPPARRRHVNPQLVGLGVEVDNQLHLLGDHHVVTRGRGPSRIGRPPCLEGGGRRIARRPQLVGVVAAKIQKPRRAQPAARAVDGEGWVGYVDVSGLLGCRHVQFRILVDAGTRAGRRRITATDILGAVRAGSLWRLWPPAILPATFLLSSCEAPGGVSPIFPNPVSPNGQDIYNTYIGISIPAILVFVAVELALLWVVIKYRRSKQPAGYIPPQIHGNHTLEIAWTLAPLIIVLAIAGYSFAELQKDFQPVSNYDFEVVVSGHQFGWNYTYPEGFTVHQEGTLAGDVTPFVVPVDKLIRLRMQGTDVIHSWWVPAISGKTDAVPGYDNFTWLKVSQVGTWRGECAELCGAGHSTMQIIVQSMNQYDYDRWVRQQLASASPKPS